MPSSKYWSIINKNIPCLKSSLYFAGIPRKHLPTTIWYFSDRTSSPRRTKDYKLWVLQTSMENICMSFPQPLKQIPACLYFTLPVLLLMNKILSTNLIYITLLHHISGFEKKPCSGSDFISSTSYAFILAELCCNCCLSWLQLLWLSIAKCFWNMQKRCDVMVRVSKYGASIRVFHELWSLFYWGLQ